MAISPSEWEWFGHAGHFICGRWCRFHLCTKVGPYLVSTVGEFVHPRHSKGSERTEAEWLAKNPNGADIGCDRKYETMVFKADNTPCDSLECGCGMPGLGDDGQELDMLPANKAGDARDNHMTLCEHYAEMEAENDESPASE